MKNHCTYIISSPPQTPWWGHGMIPMEGNHAMELNANQKPDNGKLQQELATCRQLYEAADVRFLLKPFSPVLDAQYRHDGVFCTDAMVTTQGKNGSPLAFKSNFSARFRQPEAESMERFMKLQSIGAITLDPEQKLEGGDAHYTPYDHLYIGGLFRANEQGHHAVIAQSDVTDAVLLKTDGFHVDTVLVPALDIRGRLKAIVACKQKIENVSWDKLHAFATRNGAELLEIDSVDSIGSGAQHYSDGQYAVNCMPLPGVLLGNGKFKTPGIEDRLKKLGIDHPCSPMPECAKSGGAFHCLTQQIPVHHPQEVITWYMIGEAMELYKLLQHPPSDPIERELMNRQLPLMQFESLHQFGLDAKAIKILAQARETFLSAV